MRVKTVSQITEHRAKTVLRKKTLSLSKVSSQGLWEGDLDCVREEPGGSILSRDVHTGSY